MEVPVFDECPDVTHEMADAAFEAFSKTLKAMDIGLMWSSLVPMYFAVQAAIDAKGKSGSA